MKEILPDIFHWTTFHEGIGQNVDSYYISARAFAVVIDPRVPSEGLGWFDAHQLPSHALLTNRHHYRHSGQFEKAFGTKVWCHEEGLHEFKKGEAVSPFRHGDELPGGVRAMAVGVLCPDETAFYIPLSDGIIAVGDAIIRIAGHLAFVPDPLLGDDPIAIKRGLRDVFLAHLKLDFDHLLFAHGAPWIGGARAGLQQFLTAI